MNFDVLDKLLEDKKPDEPSTLELIYYLFWERGISLEEFNRLPLPYIFSMLRAYHHIKKLEKKEYDKLRKKNR